MFGKFIYKYSNSVLLGVLTFGLYLAFQLPKLEIALDFSNYFPSDSQELDFYEGYQEIFGSKDNFVTIAIYRSEGIFEYNFLQQVDSLILSCSSLQLVNKVNSITRLSLPKKSIFGVVRQPLMNLENAEAIKKDSIRISRYPDLSNRFISKDGTTLAIMLELEPGRSMEDSKQLTSNLDSIISGFAFEQVHIAGAADMEARYAWESEKELKRFVVMCLLLIIVVLYIIYRSIPVVLISLGVFLLSLIYLGGVLVMAGQKMDIMAPMIPSIILIVSISDVIHILARYSESNQQIEERQLAINDVSKTNFLTSFTTAIGFFTLMLSPLPMLYYFGMFVGIGVLLTYVVSILLVPALLFATRSSPKSPKGFFSLKQWAKIVPILENIGRNNSKQIVWICLLLMLLSLAGISIIDSNRTIVSPMPADNPVTKAFKFFDERFDGARDFEIAVYAKKQESLSDLNNLRELEKLHNYLDSIPQVGGLVSPVTYYKWLNSFNYLMSPNKIILPNTQLIINRQEQTVPDEFKNEFRSVLDSTRTLGAMRGRMPDLGTHKAKRLLNEIDNWIEGNVDTSAFYFNHTGTPLILDLANDIQIRAMFMGLLFAIICISLMMALLFYSWRIVVITLLINLVPLIIVGGLMGFLDIELRGGTSIVFSIAFVLAVDDTIHFLNNVFFRKRKGLTMEVAISETLLYTGQPIFITSLIIFLAFSLIATSHFGNVKYLGILVSLTTIFALLSDLFLVPLLLRYFRKS